MSRKKTKQLSKLGKKTFVFSKGMNTDYFIEGNPLKRFEKAHVVTSGDALGCTHSAQVHTLYSKVQFICLWDFERARTDQVGIFVSDHVFLSS